MEECHEEEEQASRGARKCAGGAGLCSSRGRCDHCRRGDRRGGGAPDGGRDESVRATARERITPYKQQAVDSVSPYAQQAADLVRKRVGPYAQQVSGVVGPYAKTARQRGATVAYDAVEKLGPALEDALDKVPPAVEIARTRMHDEVLPRLAEALAAAAAVPVVVEAAGAVENGAGAASDPKRRGLKRLIIVVAIGGIAAIVARKLLRSPDTDWQAMRPTAPAVPTPAPAPSPATSTGSAASPATDLTSAPAAANGTTGVNPEEDCATTAVAATNESPTQLESELDTIETAAGSDADESSAERGAVDEADGDELPTSDATAERDEASVSESAEPQDGDKR